jgi:hypothetical protein
MSPKSRQARLTAKRVNDRGVDELMKSVRLGRKEGFSDDALRDAYLQMGIREDIVEEALNTQILYSK